MFRKSIVSLFLVLSFFLYPQDSDIIKKEVEKEEIIREPLDQKMTFGLGVFLPLFFEDPYSSGSDNKYFNILKNKNMSPGASINFRYGLFITSGLNIGIDLSPNISFGSNNDIIFIMFVGPTIEYYFRAYPIEIPLRLTFGISVMQYKDLSNISFFLKPGISMIWDIKQSWGVGLNVDYVFVPQIYSGKHEIPKNQSRLGNFLNIYISLDYVVAKK